MAQPLRALAALALAEDPGLVPSTHMPTPMTSGNSSSRRSIPSSAPQAPEQIWRTYTHSRRHEHPTPPHKPNTGRCETGSQFISGSSLVTIQILTRNILFLELGLLNQTWNVSTQEAEVGGFKASWAVE